ncbi:MAG: hypothetical protein OXU25_05120 [Thaumarchaeota archaeon]|nr:hypothetical protein [Nitrososphaerota archaeon]
MARSPNDNRADSMNPQTRAGKAAAANLARQAAKAAGTSRPGYRDLRHRPGLSTTAPSETKETLRARKAPRRRASRRKSRAASCRTMLGLPWLLTVGVLVGITTGVIEIAKTVAQFFK